MKLKDVEPSLVFFASILAGVGFTVGQFIAGKAIQALFVIGG